MGITHEWCEKGIEPHMDKVRDLKTEDFSWFNKKIRTSEYLHIPDTQKLHPEASAEKRIWTGYSIKSTLNIPITRNAEVIGFMGFNCLGKKNKWSEEHISLLKVIAGIISSILEKKWERKQTLEREIQLKNAQRIGHIGSWEFNLGTGQVRASEEAFRIYGYDNKNQTPDIPEVQSFVIPEDRPALDKAFNELVQLNKPYDVEFCIKRQNDGLIRHIHSIAEYDPEGNIITGTIQDITERKIAEIQLQNKTEMLDMALEATHAGIWHVDLTTGEIILHGLDIWEKLTGYTTDDFPEFNLELWKKLTHPDDIDYVFEKLQRLISGEDRYYIEEYRMLHKEGHWIWVRAHGKISQYDEKGNPLHLYGTHISIDENKKAEEKAKNASLAKSEFLANISHEIRTPLNGIIGFSELLLRTELSDLQLNYLKTVNSSGNSLLDLLNDVLDISKIEAGKLELEPENTNLSELCEQVAGMLKYRIHESDLELLLNLPPDLPRCVSADRVRLRQVLVNLLGNAAKFTHEGEIELKVEAFPVKDNPGTMDFVFSVRDTGIGIAKEKQSKIFDSFSQADGSITRKYGGTGLGLSISNRLLEKMNSKLELKSAEGKGSTFYFTVSLPVKQLNPEMWNIPHGIVKVLIVDDNKINCRIISNMLDGLGIKNEIASNCEDAITKLRENDSYSFMMIDRHLPLPDHCSNIPQILESKLSKEIPVILMNSSTDLSFACTGHEYKVPCTNIFKPVVTSELVEVINNIFSDIEENPIQKPVSLPETGDDLSYTVLICEDNKTNLLLTTTIISEMLPGSRILNAEDGNAAVQVYRENKPGIIFMDIQMPEMSGYDVTSSIRGLEAQSNIHTPIIALTAGTVQGERERCIAAGMDDYLSKPIDSDKIKIILDKWLLKKGKTMKQDVDAAKKKLVHFDKKQMLENTDVNMEIQNELVSMAISSFERNYGEIVESFSNNDIEKVKTTAHNVKGTALNIGFNIMADISGRLEDIESADYGKITLLIEEMKEELEYLKNMIW
ncbi:MAG: response regulator [Methanolobus sp.]